MSSAEIYKAMIEESFDFFKEAIASARGLSEEQMAFVYGRAAADRDSGEGAGADRRRDVLRRTGRCAFRKISG